MTLVLNVDLTEQGDRIRRAREWVGLTQGGLGEDVGVSGQSISQYEAGEVDPRGRILRLIAIATGQSIDWLQGIEDASFDPSVAKTRLSGFRLRGLLSIPTPLLIAA